MSIINYIKIVVMSVVMFCALNGMGVAQQWTGAADANGKIFRPGNVVIGLQPASRNIRDTDAMLEVSRTLAGSGVPLISAKTTYQDNTSTIFQVVSNGVYVGGANSKTSLLPSGSYDFAVGRGAVIGMNSITDRLPTDYRLAVGGKILAEEIRVKQIADWADYVFDTDYQLRSLPELEDYINTHHHLPDIPSASEVKQEGIGLGEMQATLLLKIEELTLHMIKQHKTIETLQNQLASLEQGQNSRSSGNPEEEPARMGERMDP